MAPVSGPGGTLVYSSVCCAGQLDTGHVHLYSCDLYCGHCVLPEVPGDELALNVRPLSSWDTLNSGGKLTVFRFLRKRMH